MKKLVLFGIISILGLLTFSLAYDLTSADQTFVNSFTKKLEKIIEEKWENIRDQIVSIIKLHSTKNKSKSRISNILNEIANKLSKEEKIEIEPDIDIDYCIEKGKENDDKFVHPYFPSYLTVDEVNLNNIEDLDIPFYKDGQHESIPFSHLYYDVGSGTKSVKIVWDHEGDKKIIDVPLKDLQEESISTEISLKEWNMAYGVNTYYVVIYNQDNIKITKKVIITYYDEIKINDDITLYFDIRSLKKNINGEISLKNISLNKEFSCEGFEKTVDERWTELCLTDIPWDKYINVSNMLLGYYPQDVLIKEKWEYKLLEDKPIFFNKQEWIFEVLDYSREDISHNCGGNLEYTRLWHNFAHTINYDKNTERFTIRKDSIGFDIVCDLNDPKILTQSLAKSYGIEKLAEYGYNKDNLTIDTKWFYHRNIHTPVYKMVIDLAYGNYDGGEIQIIWINGKNKKDITLELYNEIEYWSWYLDLGLNKWNMAYGENHYYVIYSSDEGMKFQRRDVVSYYDEIKINDDITLYLNESNFKKNTQWDVYMDRWNRPIEGKVLIKENWEYKIINSHFIYNKEKWLIQFFDGDCKVILQKKDNPYFSHDNGWFTYMYPDTDNFEYDFENQILSYKKQNEVDYELVCDTKNNRIAKLICKDKR